MGTAGEKRRPIGLGTYGFFLLLFALVLVCTHLFLIKLPYYWDEAGQFIPAALDIFRNGAWIPHSAVPNVHPPLLMGYLAAAWTLAGYHTYVTRAAMLLLACFALLIAFLLSIELSRETRGAPAFLAVMLLCASPLFFAQAMLAQLDAPAMLFTALALLLFLQDRVALCAAACVVLVLVKETGIAVPLVFALWLAHERRWKDAGWFVAPAVALAAWLAVLFHATGHWLGSAGFTQYNLYYPLNPARVGVALVRRVYQLFIANFHWIGTLAILYAWRAGRVFHSRAWKIGWLLLAVHVLLVTVLGGAVLERYLLSVLPVLFAAMAAALSVLRPGLRNACSAVLLFGVAVGNFINPPYPFPYEDNLAFADFLTLHANAADYVQHFYSEARVHSVWPMTVELAHPDLGFVNRPVRIQSMANFAPATLQATDWDNVQVLIAFSRDWDPEFSLMHFGPVQRFWTRFYGYSPNATMKETRARVPFPVQQHFERRGQWIDVYVNPKTPASPAIPTRPPAAMRVSLD